MQPRETPGVLFSGTDSLGERVQSRVPDACVVKCFNSVSNAQMVEPEFEEDTPPMMICGNDAEAKEHTEQILVEFGWPGALDIGPIDSARSLEALARSGSGSGRSWIPGCTPSMPFSSTIPRSFRP